MVKILSEEMGMSEAIDMLMLTNIRGNADPEDFANPEGPLRTITVHVPVPKKIYDIIKATARQFCEIIEAKEGVVEEMQKEVVNGFVSQLFFNGLSDALNRVEKEIKAHGYEGGSIGLAVIKKGGGKDER